MNNELYNLNDPSARLTETDYLADYSILNNTNIEYPELTLIELLQKQAKATPENIAIEFNNVETTYCDLDKRANQIAHYLVNQGLKPGDIIGVSLLRSTDLVATLIAVLKCGGTYVPLDPNFPIQRLDYMLQDAEAKFIIINKKNNLKFSNSLKTLFLEETLSNLSKLPTTSIDIAVDQNSIAYILYTSGSTGKPKGVPIKHQNLVNLLFSLAKEHSVNESDKQLAITTISFDAAFVELFLPLIKGALIVMVDSATAKDGVLLLKILKNKKITMLQATPTTWEMLLASNWDEKLKLKACSGGEKLTKELAHKILSRCDTLWNVYGPTEATIVSTVKKITLEDEIISIGKPIANYQIYIVNSNGQLVPPGIVGEIAIAGKGIAKGYLKRENLTKEKFIINKFNSKLTYLTGDLGKLLPSGDILCLGRSDNQVKIRGYRIELGEVERTLENIDTIKTAVVLSHNERLIAYVLQENYEKVGNTIIKEWKNYLALKLPEYFIPHNFNIVKELPVTPSGKLDRNALLKISNSKAVSNGVITNPIDQNEKLVAKIWKEALVIDSIDITSNFFEMGGHSIMAVKIMMELQKQTGKEFPLSSLFQYSTVEKFAKLLSSKKEFSSDYLVALKPLGTKTPLFIIHGAGLNILNFSHVINHFDQEQPVYGFQGIGPNGYKDWFESIEDMAATYIQSIIKVNPNGPYAIAGFSFGGIVAFEIARQLKEQGKKVSIIALLDSYVDTSYYYPSALQKKLIRHRDRTQRRLDYSFQMLTSWKAFKIRFNSKKQYLQQKYFGLETVMPEQEADALVKFTEANAMVNKIVDRYHLRPQELEVELFRAEEDESYKLDPTHLGWKKAALNGVNIHNISGNHLDIVAPPNDKILARMLQDLLDERHRQS
jgi:amino acid adenylation domain-containing protein